MRPLSRQPNARDCVLAKDVAERLQDERVSPKVVSQCPPSLAPDRDHRLRLAI